MHSCIRTVHERTIHVASDLQYSHASLIPSNHTKHILQNVYIYAYVIHVRYFKERLTRLGWIGSALIILGCVLCIIFGASNEGEIAVRELKAAASKPVFVVFSVIHISLICVALYIGKTWKPRQRAYIDQEAAKSQTTHSSPALVTRTVTESDDSHHMTTTAVASAVNDNVTSTIASQSHCRSGLGR